MDIVLSAKVKRVKTAGGTPFYVLNHEAEIRNGFVGEEILHNWRHPVTYGLTFKIKDIWKF